MRVLVEGQVMKVNVKEEEKDGKKTGVVKKTVHLYQDGENALIPVRVPFDFDATVGQVISVFGRVATWANNNGGFSSMLFALEQRA